MHAPKAAESKPVQGGKPAKRRRTSRKSEQPAAPLGYYSRQFPDRESADREAHQVSGLQDEIAMLRLYIRRVNELAEGVTSLEEAISVLKTLGSASAKLASLLKTHKQLGGDSDQVTAALAAALAEINQEMGRGEDEP